MWLDRRVLLCTTALAIPIGLLAGIPVAQAQTPTGPCYNNALCSLNSLGISNTLTGPDGGTWTSGGLAGVTSLRLAPPTVTGVTASGTGYALYGTATFNLGSGASGIYESNFSKTTVEGDSGSGAQVWANFDQLLSATADSTSPLVDLYVQSVREDSTPDAAQWGLIVEDRDETGLETSQAGNWLGAEFDLAVNGPDNVTLGRQGIVITELNGTGSGTPGEATCALCIFNGGGGGYGYYSTLEFAAPARDASIDMRNVGAWGGSGSGNGFGLWFKTGLAMAFNTNGTDTLMDNGSGDLEVSSPLWFYGSAGSGYQANLISVLSGTKYQEGVLVGPRAGAAAPSSIGYGLVAVGPSSFQFLTTAGSESVGVGPYTGQMMTSGVYAVTALGEHAIGWAGMSGDTAPEYDTATGNDSMRDTQNALNDTAYGAQAIRDGSVSSDSAFGTLALNGNAGSIQLSGTLHTGDVIHMSFSTTNSGVVGLPASTTYTILSGDTLTTAAAGMETAINNNLAGTVYFTMPDGGSSWQENGTTLAAFVESAGNVPGYVGLHFPGTSTTGWDITATASCSGNCTDTSLTVTNGMTGGDNIAIGHETLYGIGLTSADYDVAIGDFTMSTATSTANLDTCVGYSACFAATTDSVVAAFGAYAGYSMNGAQGETFIGPYAGFGVTIGIDDTIIGDQNATHNSVTTGSGDLELGFSAEVASPTSNWQVSIQNGLYCSNCNSTDSTPFDAEWGVNQASPRSELDIAGFLSFDAQPSSSGGSSASAPTGSTGCTVSGSNSEGYVTVSSESSCTITFGTGGAGIPSSYDVFLTPATIGTIAMNVSAQSSTSFTAAFPASESGRFNYLVIKH